MTYAWELGGGGGGGGGDTITSPNGTITVGGTSTNSTVDVDSTVVPLLANNNVYAGLNNQSQQIVTKTTTYTTTTADWGVIGDTSGGAFTISLVATPTTGLVQWFKNTTSTLLTISGNGKNIDGAATSTLLAAANDSMGIQYDGTQWRILWKPSSGGSAPGTGGTDYFWGAPGYTASGAACALASPSGVAHSALSFTFYSRVQTISQITFKVCAAAASGSGMIIGIYTADQSAAVCSAVASGTNVTTTGYKVLSISGCTGLVIGQPYTIVASSDDTTLSMVAYGDQFQFGIQNQGASAGTCGTTTACRAGYAASNDASTGTGASIAFTTLSGITWTSFGDGAAYYRPVFGFGN